MDKFRIDSVNQHNAIINLLAQILSNQLMLIDITLVGISEKENRNLPDLIQRFTEGATKYQENIFSDLLDKFGKLEVDDLIE